MADYEDPGYRVPGPDRRHCWVCPNGHFISVPGVCPVLLPVAQTLEGQPRTCQGNAIHISHLPQLQSIWLLGGLEAATLAWADGLRS